MARQYRPTRPAPPASELKTLDLNALRTVWREQVGKQAPACLKRDLLLRALVFRIEVRLYGDVDRATAKLLDRIANGEPAASVLARHDQRRIKPGSRLRREWQGALHEVVVTPRGFLYGGREWESLSEIARTITGTRWSGPRFFGLDRPRSNSSDASAAAADSKTGRSDTSASGDRAETRKRSGRRSVAPSVPRPSLSPVSRES
jgi:hypothetical protein